MATHTFVDFERPEASELARLTSIRHDLTSTVSLCEYIHAQIEASPNGWAPSEITDAFSTAIVVRYSRAFVTGVRRGLGEDDLAVLTEQQLASHHRLRSLRDKHVAHSVNAFEDTRVQARYCLERVQEEGITSVSAAHYRVFGLSQRDVADAKKLCTCLLAHVDALVEREKKALLSVMQGISLAEILSAPSSPLISPATSRVDKRRARP